MKRPSWFNGSLFSPRRLPGPEQPLPANAPELLPVAPAGGHPLTALLPELPHVPGWLRQDGPNQQTGAQPERQYAVQAGHPVTGAYLLHGELPTPPAVVARLSASPELLFTPNPLPFQALPVPLGPVAPYAATGHQQ